MTTGIDDPDWLNEALERANAEIERLRKLLAEVVNIDCKECRSAAIAAAGI